MKRLILSSLLIVFYSFNYGQCSNLTDGGQIGYDEVGCGPFDPSPISNIAFPSGGNGSIEYMWLATHDPNNYGPSNVIPGANSVTYDPPVIQQTTWFVRCARRVGCTDWLGESIVEKRVVNLSATAS